MDKGRFSLLLLDPGEIYFEDYSSILVLPDTTPQSYEFKKQDGRLKMCSKSLVFDPKDINKPLVKIPLRECIVLEQWKGSAKFITSKNVLSVQCRQYAEMLAGNVISPYKFCDIGHFLFILNYANISDCLPQICQLHRASTLHSEEQSDMIATIVHSRHSRVQFDPLWLDLFETVVMETQADKINPLVLNPGRILLSNAKLYFQPYNNIEMPVIKINLEIIRKIMRRRFLLRHVGLEIFTDDNVNIPHIYLSFANQKERDNLYSSILKQPILKLSPIEQDVMTLQWQNGVISNYDYLLYINSLGDRTFNDLTQYPVFPWIISDYTSNTLDVSDPNVYRDLSQPIGALNKERLQRLLDRCAEMTQHPKFIYGSHYSTPGFVLFYLVRVYPHYMLCLQNGRFDHPDRMFNAVCDVWRNCLNNMSDFKEVIPEFYDTSCTGAFLQNKLGIHFGYRHNGLRVNDVELPPWAKDSKHFVKTLRDALENDIVSSQLHHWIDLMFGYKQRGEEAEKANNLFYYMCYEGNVNLDAISDHNEKHALEVQIMEFGQVPKQVFLLPHPRRKPQQEIVLTPEQICHPSEGNCIDIKTIELRGTFASHKDTVASVGVIEDSKILSVGHDTRLKVFSIDQNRQIRSVNVGDMPLNCFVKLPGLNTVVIGNTANEIILYDLQFGRITQTVTVHDDAITTLLWDDRNKFLYSGSGDSTVQIWRGFNEDGIIKPIHFLIRQLEHNGQVTSCCLDSGNTHLAVGTIDGEVYVWRIKDFYLLNKYSFHSAAVNKICYTDDGLKLITCSEDCCFQITDTTTGTALYRKQLELPITAMKLSEYLLILGCDNGSLFLWDIMLVKLLFEHNAHDGRITDIDIADKSIIITASTDQLIKLWSMCAH